MPRHRNRPSVCLFSLLAVLTACTTWREQSGPVPEVLAEKDPGVVRVTRQDQSRVLLTEPKVSADALQGQVDGKPTEVPLSDVKSIAIAQSDGGKTLGAVLIVVVAAAAGFAALGSSAASD